MTLTQGAVPQLPRPSGLTLKVGQDRFTVCITYFSKEEAQRAYAKIEGLLPPPPEQP